MMSRTRRATSGASRDITVTAVTVVGVLLQIAFSQYASVVAAAGLRPSVAAVNLQTSLFD